MKNLKRIFKILALVIIISLASLGIGLTGAAPISFTKRDRTKNEANTEQVEQREEPDQSEIKEIG